LIFDLLLLSSSLLALSQSIRQTSPCDAVTRTNNEQVTSITCARALLLSPGCERASPSRASEHQTSKYLSLLCLGGVFDRTNFTWTSDINGENERGR
jgi:hypothetical protein